MRPVAAQWRRPSSYVAAGIAKADINQVGWTAFFYGITSYILPFMFFFGPGLMLNGEWVDIILAVVSGFIGVYCIATFGVGWFKRSLPVWQRALMALAGIALLNQGVMTDGIDLALFILVFAINKKDGPQEQTISA